MNLEEIHANFRHALQMMDVAQERRSAETMAATIAAGLIASGVAPAKAPELAADMMIRVKREVQKKQVNGEGI